MGKEKREACPLCDGKTFKPLMEEEGARYIRCSACNLIYTIEAPDERELSDIAEEWAKKHLGFIAEAFRVLRPGGWFVNVNTIGVNSIDIRSVLLKKNDYSFQDRQKSISKTKEMFSRLPMLSRAGNMVNELLNFGRLGDVIELYAERWR